jgi:hypothetical protein
MGLLNGDKEQEAKEQEQEANAEMGRTGDDTSYLDAMAGDGLDGFADPNSVSTPYLSMVQPQSQIVSEDVKPGQWRNSLTGELYGPTVEVIPLAFKTVWTERTSTPPFTTVGRYLPNSIEVAIERPKPGVRGFPKMTNPTTGNKVEELFIYACVLKQAPNEGLIYFSPTAFSMKTCKQWNAMLRSQRLPSGKIAPIYAFSWNLTLELARTSSGNTAARFAKVTRGTIADYSLFTSYVQPQLSYAQNVAALAAPENTGDMEDE